MSLRPTCRVRWRALTEEGADRQKSILEQLWVSDDAARGEWLPVDRVPLEAPTFAEGADLWAIGVPAGR